MKDKSLMVGLGVVGIDLSVSRPAAVRIPNGWQLGDWAHLGVAAWPSKPEKGLSGDAERIAKWDRVARTVDNICHFVLAYPGMPVYIEDYVHGQFPTTVAKTAEVRGALCHTLRSQGIYVRPVPIATARKLLLGKLPSRKKGDPPLPKGAAKVAVEQALILAGASDVLADDDECDAFAVANAALAMQGSPFVCLGSSGGAWRLAPSLRSR